MESAAVIECADQKENHREKSAILISVIFLALASPDNLFSLILRYQSVVFDCLFFACNMAISLFGFAHQFDMLLVEGNTNLEEAGNAFLLHRRDILLSFDLCQSILGRSLKLSVNAGFVGTVL